MIIIKQVTNFCVDMDFDIDFVLKIMSPLLNPKM